MAQVAPSGKTLQRRLRLAQDNGFLVAIAFLVIPEPDYSLTRIAERVQRGGHDIPEADVRRRFGRTRENFETIYKPLARCWYVLDAKLRELPVMESGGPEIGDDPLGLLVREPAPAQGWTLERDLIDETFFSGPEALAAAARECWRDLVRARRAENETILITVGTRAVPVSAWDVWLPEDGEPRKGSALD